MLPKDKSHLHLISLFVALLTGYWVNGTSLTTEDRKQICDLLTPYIK